MYESQKTLLFKKKGRRRGTIPLAMIEYYTLQMCQKQGKAATRIDKSNYIFLCSTAKLWNWKLWKATKIASRECLLGCAGRCSIWLTIKSYEPPGPDFAPAVRFLHFLHRPPQDAAERAEIQPISFTFHTSHKLVAHHKGNWYNIT